MQNRNVPVGLSSLRDGDRIRQVNLKDTWQILELDLTDPGDRRVFVLHVWAILRAQGQLEGVSPADWIEGKNYCWEKARLQFRPDKPAISFAKVMKNIKRWQREVGFVADATSDPAAVLYRTRAGKICIIVEQEVFFNHVPFPFTTSAVIEHAFSSWQWTFDDSFNKIHRLLLEAASQQQPPVRDPRLVAVVPLPVLDTNTGRMIFKPILVRDQDRLTFVREAIRTSALITVESVRQEALHKPLFLHGIDGCRFNLPKKP